MLCRCGYAKSWMYWTISWYNPNCCYWFVVSIWARSNKWTIVLDRLDNVCHIYCEISCSIKKLKMEWINWNFCSSQTNSKKIESSNEQGVRYPGIVNPLFGNHKMYGVTAVTTECELFSSQCQFNNGDCPSNSICLVNPNAPSGRFCKPISNN